MAEHLVESPEKAAMRRRVTEADASPMVEARGRAAHPLLRLQGQIGNAHVARMLAQRAEAGKDEDEATAAATHDVSLQRDDDDEDKPAAASHDLAQRAEADEEQGAVGAKHETVGIEGGPVGPDTQSRIHEMRGGGSSLDEGTRGSMESAFGTSFSDVRVHSGHEADTLNRRLTARAFTTGNDIFLRSDASPSDTRLMAHELTHVVQQRTMSGGGGMQVGAAGDGHERHADSVAEAVTTAAPKPAAAPTAQRAADQESADEVQAQHDAMAQRAEAGKDEDEATAAATHDVSLQRDDDDEDKPAAASHDLAQRAEADEEE